jgi:dTDP-4-dehydrorhamnose reductase
MPRNLLDEFHPASVKRIHMTGPAQRDIVLITGAHGFLGQHVVRLFLEESKCDIVITARQDKTLFVDIADEPRVLSYIPLDVTQRHMVRDVVSSVKPTVIVNCAGYVNVDAAEANREAAWRTNVTAIEYLAEAARKVDARIVHVSTDFVFDGLRVPYLETDIPHPLNYYGRTKLASENALRTSGIDYTIFRVCMLYGAAERLAVNYPLEVIHSLESGKPVHAATDLYSSPTLIDDLALAIVRATERRRFGLYHVAGPEMLSRFEFAQRVAEAFRVDGSLILPTTSAEVKKLIPGRAERPLKSALVSLKAQTDLGVRLSNVSEGLQVMERGLHDLLGEGATHLYE